MYKLLIVDDEKMVREGLQDIIEYLKVPQIGPLLTARDGADALEVIAREEPPIVLTDLNMPGMGGLEMLRTLRERHQRHKIIVISGYDDFHLVKESFKLGVRDYLLKPVHSGDLAEVLNKTVHELQHEQQQDLEGHSEQKLALLEKASRGMNQVLHTAPDDHDAIQAVLGELGCRFPHPVTAAAIVSVSQPAPHEPSAGGNWEHILLAADWEQPHLSLLPFYNRHNDLVLWLNYDDQMYDDGGIRKLLQPFLADGSAAVAVGAAVHCAPGAVQPAAAGATESGSRTSGLAFAYQSALDTLQYKLTASRHSLIVYEDTLNKEDTRIKPEHLRTLVELIDMGRREQVLPLIQHYFNEEALKSSSMSSIRHNYEIILHTIGWLPGQKRDLSTFERSEALRLYLKSCILHMIEARASLAHSGDVVEIAKTYVQEQLLNGINMAFIANYCNMSYNYFSKMFKDSTGVNFQDYVTMKRMEYARQALSGLNVKIHTVSEQLGYSNPKNFSRVFKSYFGVSPKEYQKHSR
ncbi:response regulator [Paenibacillus sp. FSL M7-0896]|uniref:response regulator n=1 Tax=Paenibacillus sp. FSL M7-0896 TaxID=2921610 RepID=UPI0030DCE728